METILPIIQIILGVALIALVLLEVQSSGSSSVLGGSQNTISRKRRGPQLLMFRLTIGTSVLFFISALANVLVGS